MVYGACDDGWEISLDVFHFSMTCSSTGVWDPTPQCNSTYLCDKFICSLQLKKLLLFASLFVISLKDRLMYRSEEIIF